VRRVSQGVISASAAAREGHPSQLSPPGQEIVKRSASEQVSLLYLGDSTAVSAPLIAHGSGLGAFVVEVAHPGPRLGKHDLQLLTGIAAIVAPALATQLQLRG
jgi:hypothetical protein